MDTSLTPEQWTVYRAVLDANAQGVVANDTYLARATQLPFLEVFRITAELAHLNLVSSTGVKH